MRLVVAALVVTVLACAGVGCHKKAYVDIQPMNEKLSTWRSMSIEVVPPPRDEDLQTFQEALVRRAQQEHYLPLADPPSAELRVRVVVLDFVPGDAISRAYVTVDVELVDAKRNAMVARFRIERKTNDSLQLDPEGRATVMLRSVENVIFGWLRDHRG